MLSWAVLRACRLALPLLRHLAPRSSSGPAPVSWRFVPGPGPVTGRHMKLIVNCQALTVI
ncbi:hypothetical protein SSBG_06168 [Streptomyces sp. SPB074]|nr:hypothetical protein SSBG_06168 [Streptomyces sp. SPB074]